MLFSELENDTLNQAELNEIQINENHEIFEVPGQNENPRRGTFNRLKYLCTNVWNTGNWWRLTQNLTIIIFGGIIFKKKLDT